MCRVLAGWKNQYEGKYNWFAKANDRVDFTTTNSANLETKDKRKHHMFQMQQKRELLERMQRKWQRRWGQWKRIKFSGNATKIGCIRSRSSRHHRIRALTKLQVWHRWWRVPSFCLCTKICTMFYTRWGGNSKQLDISRQSINFETLLTNICDAKWKLVLFCNAGKTLVTKKGDLKGYGTIWYHPQGIANILSLSNMQKKFRVTYDSTLNQGFVIHKADGTTWMFKP